MFKAPRRPVNPPRWCVRPQRSPPQAPETCGKAYSRLHAPSALGSSLPRARGPSHGQSTARPGRPGAPAASAQRGPAPGSRPRAASGPPPPGVLPASSSGTSRRRCHRRCETRVPQSRSRRLPPAFQAAPAPPLPLPAGSHFRQVTAELSEVRRAGNGRTRRSEPRRAAFERFRTAPEGPPGARLRVRRRRARAGSCGPARDCGKRGGEGSERRERWERRCGAGPAGPRPPRKA